MKGSEMVDTAVTNFVREIKEAHHRRMASTSAEWWEWIQHGADVSEYARVVLVAVLEDFAGKFEAYDREETPGSLRVHIDDGTQKIGDLASFLDPIAGSVLVDKQYLPGHARAPLPELEDLYAHRYRRRHVD